MPDKRKVSKMATNLTKESIEGFDAMSNSDRRGVSVNPCKYLFSSDSWLAYQSGQYLFSTGRTRPIKAMKSRGYSVKIETESGMIFLFKAEGDDLENMRLERL